MKVLLINGSPRKNGNTSIALAETAKRLEADGIDTETVWIGAKAVQGCIACGKCGELGHCAFNDKLLNELVVPIEIVCRLRRSGFRRFRSRV